MRFVYIKSQKIILFNLVLHEHYHQPVSSKN